MTKRRKPFFRSVNLHPPSINILLFIHHIITAIIAHAASDPAHQDQTETALATPQASTTKAPHARLYALLTEW